jgi:hypothetical protein
MISYNTNLYRANIREGVRARGSLATLTFVLSLQRRARRLGSRETKLQDRIFALG